MGCVGGAGGGLDELGALGLRVEEAAEGFAFGRGADDELNSVSRLDSLGAVTPQSLLPLVAVFG